MKLIGYCISTNKVFSTSIFSPEGHIFAIYKTNFADRNFPYQVKDLVTDKLWGNLLTMRHITEQCKMLKETKLLKLLLDQYLDTRNIP